MPSNQNVDHFSRDNRMAVDQVMGNPPSWIIYWGITIIAIFLTIILGISASIQYPDILHAEAIAYLGKPPIDVFAIRNGKIDILMVQNKDTVQENDPLFALESTAEWQAVLKLDTLLKQKTESIIDAKLLSKELGTLNTAYQELALLEIKRKDANKSNISASRRHQIQEEIHQNKALHIALQKQKEIFEKELLNIKKDLDRSKQLLQEGVLSEQALELKENVYLQNEREYYQLESAIISKAIKIEQLRAQITEIEKQKHDLFFQMEIEFLQKKEALRTAVKQWKKEYIIFAPSSGIIVLSYQIQEGTKITNTEPIMTIMPRSSLKRSFLKATMKANGIGQIALNQEAKVYFENYPSIEYGTLIAVVESIAPIPTKKQYEIVLRLPENWISNYGIAIPKQQKMSATIALKTKEYTLLERIFSGLLEAL